MWDDDNLMADGTQWTTEKKHSKIGDCEVLSDGKIN